MLTGIDEWNIWEKISSDYEREVSLYKKDYVMWHWQVSTFARLWLSLQYYIYVYFNDNQCLASLLATPSPFSAIVHVFFNNQCFFCCFLLWLDIRTWHCLFFMYFIQQCHQTLHLSTACSVDILVISFLFFLSRIKCVSHGFCLYKVIIHWNCNSTINFQVCILRWINVKYTFSPFPLKLTKDYNKKHKVSRRLCE